MTWLPDFWKVEPPYWDDKPVLIVGTGPSLKDFDHARLQGMGYVLAVKQAWRNLPFADAVCGIDIPWMGWESENLTALAKIKPVYLAVPDQKIKGERVPDATYLIRSRAGTGLSNNPAVIESGGNSGFGALNIAWLKRAKKIALFGYDYSGVHHTPEHYAARNRPADANDRYLVRWAKNYDAVTRQAQVAGVTILNACPGSNVTAFPKVTHDEAFELIRQWDKK